jgi:hypothetical protein
LEAFSLRNPEITLREDKSSIQAKCKGYQKNAYSTEDGKDNTAI